MVTIRVILGELEAVEVVKLLLQVPTYAWLTKVDNGPCLLNSTQKELSIETLMMINKVISAEL